MSDSIPFVRNEDEVNRLLKKWRGRDVQLWEYRATHSTLRLRFKYTGPVELEIVCSGCEWVQGPTRWKNGELKLSMEGKEYVLEDKVWEFKVRAMLVSASEVSVRG